MSIPVQVRLNEVFHQRLKAAAAVRGLSTVELIRRLVERGLDLDSALDPVHVAIREAKDEIAAAASRSIELFSERADQKAERVEQFVSRNLQAVMELLESLLAGPETVRAAAKPTGPSPTNPFAK